MKIRLIALLVISLCLHGNNAYANHFVVKDSIQNEISPLNPDDILQIFQNKHDQQVQQATQNTLDTLVKSNGHTAVSTKIKVEQPAYDIKKRINELQLVKVDSLLLLNNPFFIDLVYRDKTINFNWKSHLKPYSFFYESAYDTVRSSVFKKYEIPTAYQIITDLRNDIYQKNMFSSPKFFAFRADKLPSTSDLKNTSLSGTSLDKIKITQDGNLPFKGNKQLTVEQVKVTHWTKKANTMFQFSQYYASENWYQGGTDYISILGILNGQLNYDNKKNVQWENFGEWRLGFNSVENAIRVFNTNEDILKTTSKLGIRAGGNFYYSSSMDFSAQLFNNYKSPTSTELKATFLTPVRLNIGIGMDYKYKKLFSLMLAPISYKYIYVNNTTKVPSTSFGILEGENHLSQVGSSFRAQVSYSPVREIQLDSKLTFYTNYEKIEVDWEIVTNFTVNRFLSTRLAINPRYDNTVILPNNEKAKIQFKELLSFGFSYKLLN